MDFPGTLSVNPETLSSYAGEIARSMIQQGFDKLVLLDGHGGNYGILDLLIEDLFID